MMEAKRKVQEQERAVYARAATFMYWEYMRKLDMQKLYKSPNYQNGQGIFWDPKTGERYDTFYKERYDNVYRFYFDVFANKYYDAEKNILNDPMYRMPLPKTDYFLYGQYKDYANSAYVSPWK